MITTWPETPDDLAREQDRIAALPSEPWTAPLGPLRIGACAVVFAGRDHPRGAGLALHLGAVLGIPTAGVTDDPLLATGGEPSPARGSLAPLRAGPAIVAYRVRTREGATPVVAHAGWRTSAERAADLVVANCAAARWPEPPREARRLARALRAGDPSR